ncbi:CBS domain-containing protein [Salinactinospora qingdaonensis]|uniref:CBS domain-containing protein n=1 Tax=Salinactinospora qingdaonensis TaxID=702744 RepID=A0ABP7GC30_9ACTN
MHSTVGDVMTSDAVWLHKNAGYKEIVETLLEQEVNSLPVTDDTGSVVGVVSDEDLVRKEEFYGEGVADDYRPAIRAHLRSMLGSGGFHGERAQKRALATTAGELMTQPPITISTSASVTEAARVMERYGIRRLPVVDRHGVLAGVVSRRDLLRVFLRGDDDIAHEVREDIAFAKSTIEGIDVTETVEDGVVTLQGAVPSRSVAHMLTRQVSRIEGTVSVIDNLTWKVDDLLYPHLR